jgi:rhodanese-related sulfurtransferase
MRSTAWVSLAAFLAGCGAGGLRESGPAPADSTVAAPAGLSAVAARAFLAEHPEALVLDVRNPDEWNNELGHIEGARLMPVGELGGRLGEIEAWRDKPIVTVCRSGARSQRAAEMLRAAGFKQVINLEGGMIGWRSPGP